MARVEPIPPKSWSAEVLASIEPLDPKGRRHPPPLRDDRAAGMAALGIFAHHPALARAFSTFNGHVLWDTTLTPRHRQLLILRVAAKRGASYVWGEHSRASLHAGLSEDEVERVRSAPDDPLWMPLEAAILRAADELIDDGVISDGTWALLSATLDVQQLADLVCTIGCYETTSLLFKTFGLEARP
jgi:alkylhydroperoxidase family enzyme